MTDLPEKRTDIELTEVEDGFVVYDDTRDRVHHLNLSLAIVFELANGRRTPAEIAAAVAEEYGLDEQPLADVETALELLQAEGLLA